MRCLRTGSRCPRSTYLPSVSTGRQADNEIPVPPPPQPPCPPFPMSAHAAVTILLVVSLCDTNQNKNYCPWAWRPAALVRPALHAARGSERGGLHPRNGEIFGEVLTVPKHFAARVVHVHAVYCCTACCTADLLFAVCC